MKAEEGPGALGVGSHVQMPTVDEGSSSQDETGPANHDQVGSSLLLEHVQDTEESRLIEETRLSSPDLKMNRSAQAGMYT